MVLRAHPYIFVIKGVRRMGKTRVLIENQTFYFFAPPPSTHITLQHSKKFKNNICLVNIFWKVRFQDSTLHSYLSKNISPDLAVWTTFVISAKRITFKWP